MKRIPGFDLAKGIALIAVILFHTEVFWLQAILAPFALSTFFFSAGYFSRKEKWSVFFTKRARRLLEPYLISALLTILLSFVLGVLLYNVPTGIYRAGEWSKAMLFGFGTDQPALGVFGAGPVWFLLCLLIASLLFQIVLRLKESLRVPFLILAFLTGAILPSVMGFYLPWSVEPAMCSLPLLYGAWIIRQNQSLLPIRNHHIRGLLQAIIVGLWVDFSIHYHEFAQVSNQFNRGWIDLLFSFVLSWALIQFCCYVLENRPEMHWLSWVGKNSLTLLCFHSLDLLLLNWKDLIYSFQWPLWQSQLVLILFALLRFGLICLLVSYFNRFGWFQKIFS